jgi:hypothetical protein
MGRRASDISWRVAREGGQLHDTEVSGIRDGFNWLRNRTGGLSKADGALDRFGDSHFGKL